MVPLHAGASICIVTNSLGNQYQPGNGKQQECEEKNSSSSID
jgi:hypothetical protein